MLKGVYRLPLALSVVCLVAAIAMVAYIGLELLGEWQSNLALSAGIFLSWGALTALTLLRSLPRVTVSTDGIAVRGVGGWQLPWAEIASAMVSPAMLMVVPTKEGLARQPVRQAAQFSRWFGPRGGTPGSIMIPLRIGGDDARVRDLIAWHAASPK